MEKPHTFKLLHVTISILMIVGFTHCMHEALPTISPNGNLIFHLHSMVDSNTVFQYDSVYKVPGHRKISLHLAQLYISDIQLIKSDGSSFIINGTFLLKTLENEIYQVGSVPPRSYKAIRFSIGLDPIENLKQALSPADSLFNKPSMWFGTTAQPLGYAFLNVSGKIDTTTNGVGTQATMQPFSFKIGTNANYKQVLMNNVIFTVQSNQTQYVHFLIDYNKLLSGIQLNNPRNLFINTPADNSTDLARKICTNIPTMFLLDN